MHRKTILSNYYLHYAVIDGHNFNKEPAVAEIADRTAYYALITHHFVNNALPSSQQQK